MQRPNELILYLHFISLTIPTALILPHSYATPKTHPTPSQPSLSASLPACEFPENNRNFRSEPAGPPRRVRELCHGPSGRAAVPASARGMKTGTAPFLVAAPRRSGEALERARARRADGKRTKRAKRAVMGVDGGRGKNAVSPARFRCLLGFFGGRGARAAGR